MVCFSEGHLQPAFQLMQPVAQDRLHHAAGPLPGAAAAQAYRTANSTLALRHFSR